MPVPLLLSIAVPIPLRRNFDYLPPEGFNPADRAHLRAGIRVRVPFGNQQLIGVLLEIKRPSETLGDKWRPALEILDSDPVLPDDLLYLCRWAADYYQCPPGEVLQTALPALLRQGEAPQLRGETVWELTTEGKGLPEGALKRAPKQAILLAALQQHQFLTKLSLERLGINRPTVKALEEKGLISHSERTLTVGQPSELLFEPPLPLNEEQAAVLTQISHQHYCSYLLEGATGSGKTEVYLQAIEKALQADKQALVLVPEIGLTPQTLARFEQRFAVPIAALHSGLNDRERLQAWVEAAQGIARIVIGTRSAIFTPLPQLGIIIVDEEHDASFKQQDGFRYSARDLAAVRAHRHDIPLLLGSATPSLETLHNAVHGRYEHLRLTKRAGQARPPSVELIDIRGQTLSAGFAEPVLEAIRDTLAQGNQALVFINRRGYAPTLVCHDCGWLASCPHCDARMTVHQQPRHLHCHHCDHQRPVDARCPSCFGTDLQALGQGTERSEDTLNQLFPNSRIIRIDRDSTRRKNALATILEEVHTGRPCILVGTQMLAKGHHFPDVTLVAIIDADGGLFSADFRGPERMGQLLIQVAGRAGRADKPGRVLVQSHQVDHPLVQSLLFQGYHRFARLLLSERQIGQLPPYRYLALIKAESKHSVNALSFLQTCRQLAERLQPANLKFSYLGPLPGLMERRQGRYRFQLQLSSPHRQLLQRLLRQLAPELETHPSARRVRWAIDVDPQDMS